MLEPDTELTATAEEFLRRALPHLDVSDDVYAEVAHGLAESSPDLVRTQAGAAPDAARPLLRTALPLFYSHPGTWSVTGFEGPSFAAGGYLTRGFNDLSWLPEPRVVESDEPMVEIGSPDTRAVTA